MLFFARAGLASTLLVCLLSCATHDDKANKTKGVMPPTPVTIAQAQARDIPIQVRQIGSVEPVAVIAVKARINGELTQVFFKEGDEVKKGQQLFEIDPRPYQQALDQAQAAVQKDIALVAQAEANLARDRAQAANAKEQAQRYAGLAAEGVISKDQNDSYQTTSEVQDEAVRADQAALNSAKASVVSDNAAIETAKLNLSYCYIRSPIDGRAGSLLIQAGNLIKANDTIAVGEHQSTPAGLRHVQRARAAAAGNPPIQHRAWALCHRNRCCEWVGAQRVGNRAANLYRQHGGQHHRHHQAEG